jgi:hypothetical protein
MVTLWLVVLFALWVVLTTALALTARHSKSRETLQPSEPVRQTAQKPSGIEPSKCLILRLRNAVSQLAQNEVFAGRME